MLGWVYAKNMVLIASRVYCSLLFINHYYYYITIIIIFIIIIIIINVYDEVKFVNVSISSLGVFGESTNTLFDMLHDLKYDEQRIKYVKKKIIATCIRTSYYIFCRRNKDWNNPELLNF